MKRWRTAYLIVANTALLIMLVRFGAHLVLTAQQALQTASPIASAAAERWCTTLRFRYGGGAGFVHDARASAWLNIDAYGIRSNGARERPVAALDSATWLFGGSAAFGCGLSDAETIAAQLERLRNEPVFNLGVHGYNSAMENRLFNHYLLAGYRPRRVLFLDGVEESCADGLFESEMTAIADAMQQDYSSEFVAPLRSAVHVVRQWRLSRQPSGHSSGSEPAPMECRAEGRQLPLALIVARRLAERSALCRLYGVECHTLVPKRDVELIEHLSQAWRDAGVTFLPGTVEEPAGKWLDWMHYSPAAARGVAAAIDHHLGPRAVPPTP